MSNSYTPPGKPAKAVSSRLLTMKVIPLVLVKYKTVLIFIQFMQRAAASSQTIDDDLQTPSPKRTKLSSSSSFQTTSGSELEAIRAALTAEEAKRDAAMERQAAEAGETRWVLSFRDEQNGRDGTL